MLKALPRLLSRIAGKAAAAFPGSIGSIIAGVLNFLKKVVTAAAGHVWIFFSLLATLIGYTIYQHINQSTLGASRLFNEQLNISAAGDLVATLSHKNGKVNLYVKDDTQLSNLKISDDIAKVLKIKGNTSNSGEPVDVDKIAFSNTKNVFLVCDQIDSTVTAATVC